jgi:starch synthase
LNVVQVSIGRFHHFHLARQMERFGLLEGIWTGYPGFKLKDEIGVPKHKVHSFALLQTLSMGWSRIPIIGRSQAMHRELNWWAQESLDRRVAIALRQPRIVVALSGQGEHCGRKAQSLGGRHVCDRGSSHIRVQDRLVGEEHVRWGIDYRPIDPKMIAKEEREYAGADLITVPSGFAERSFLDSGVAPAKIRRIPYGGRLDRFKPQGEPEPGTLRLLFVGYVSLRKGVPYLLDAFARLRHPRKRLRLIGGVDPTMAPLLAKFPSEHVEFLGTVQNAELVRHYSESHALVLPSIEEGLAMVMAEAMASGCPVIASAHTGAEDLFSDGEEGLIVEAMTKLTDDPTLQRRLRHNAIERIKAIHGWDDYGERWRSLVESF